MRLTPPKKNVFYVSVALVVLGLLGRYLNIPFLSDYYFYFVLVGYIVLALGNTMKGF